MNNEDREVLKPDQAAERLHVSGGTLANWRSRDIGPAYYRVGNKILYRIEDIDTWIERQRREPAQK